MFDKFFDVLISEIKGKYLQLNNKVLLSFPIQNIIKKKKILSINRLLAVGNSPISSESIKKLLNREFPIVDKCWKISQVVELMDIADRDGYYYDVILSEIPLPANLEYYRIDQLLSKPYQIHDIINIVL